MGKLTALVAKTLSKPGRHGDGGLSPNVAPSGRKAVDAITAADVMEALTPIWTSKPDTASRVHQRMETVMDWTVAQSCRLDNPAGRSLLKALEGELRLSRTATG